MMCISFQCCVTNCCELSGLEWHACITWASQVAQWVKNPPAMQETWVRILDWEDTLEESMATRPSILAWRMLWTEEPDRLLSIGFQRIRQDWSDWACTHVYYSHVYFCDSGNQAWLCWSMAQSLWRGSWTVSSYGDLTWGGSAPELLQIVGRIHFSVAARLMVSVYCSAFRDCSWFLDMWASLSGRLFHDSL